MYRSVLTFSTYIFLQCITIQNLINIYLMNRVFIQLVKSIQSIICQVSLLSGRVRKLESPFNHLCVTHASHFSSSRFVFIGWCLNCVSFFRLLKYFSSVSFQIKDIKNQLQAHFSDMQPSLSKDKRIECFPQITTDNITHKK